MKRSEDLYKDHHTMESIENTDTGKVKNANVPKEKEINIKTTKTPERKINQKRKLSVQPNSNQNKESNVTISCVYTI